MPTPPAPLPCPFCGSTDTQPMETPGDQWHVRCWTCDAQGSLSATEAAAVAAWNAPWDRLREVLVGLQEQAKGAAELCQAMSRVAQEEEYGDGYAKACADLRGRIDEILPEAVRR